MCQRRKLIQTISISICCVGKQLHIQTVISALKQLRQLLVPLGHILSQLSTPSPLSPPYSRLTPARAWEEPATHRVDGLGKECKHKALRDMAGTEVSCKDNNHK